MLFGVLEAVGLISLWKARVLVGRQEDDQGSLSLYVAIWLGTPITLQNHSNFSSSNHSVLII
jgi:hypothetical protein